MQPRLLRSECLSDIVDLSLDSLIDIGSKNGQLIYIPYEISYALPSPPIQQYQGILSKPYEIS